MGKALFFFIINAIITMLSNKRAEVFFEDYEGFADGNVK